MAVLTNLEPRLARFAPALALLATLFGGPAAAQTTPIKFSLDFKFEGPSAPFLIAIDKGYFKAEGLEVTIDTAGGSLEPINRVASGTYDMGFGDINSLIKFRDANPGNPIKAVFMVYNKPPFSIVGRKSRGVTQPKDLEGKKLGAPAPDGAFAQWKIFVEANKIDASKVTIENVGFPVREPMLAAGQVDAITGFSFLLRAFSNRSQRSSTARARLESWTDAGMIPSIRLGDRDLPDQEYQMPKQLTTSRGRTLQ